jgi:uncharacterized protein
MKKIKSTKNEKDTAMFLHLSGFISFIFPILGWIIPIVIWLVKKDDSEYINMHGKMWLNAIISYSIYIVISFVLMIILIGFLMLAGIFIISIVETIKAAIRAKNGDAPKNYLWAFDFFKIME